MNSFDVFDTLLARRFLTATPLFNRIETELEIPDFTRRRIAADNGSSTLAEIYRALDLPQSVMDVEIALEFDNAIPVRQNLQRVRHGDLLISDMYMSASDILRMVRGVGMDKQVTIFRSNRGKSSGEVWRRLASHKPGCHLGDNIHSDFQLPKSQGFNCELYSGAALTEVEATLVRVSLPMLAYLVREIRLTATDEQSTGFSSAACQLNLPWLFFSAELLRRRHSGMLSFLGRDGQLLYRIYNSYFAACGYVPFSRQVAFTHPATAVAYLKAHSPPGGVFIDISSTGATWQKLNSDIRVDVLIYSDLHFYTTEKPVPPEGFSFVTANSQCGQTNALLEIFNCGDHGYLRSVDSISEGLMRSEFDPLQIDNALVEEIQRPVKLAESLTLVYREELRDQLERVPTELLHELFSVFAKELCSKTDLYRDPRLGQYFADESKYKALLREADAAGPVAEPNRNGIRQ